MPSSVKSQISMYPISRCMQLPILALRNILRVQNGARRRPAIFLDRDGTLNVEQGYITDPDAVALYPGVGETIHSLNSHGYPVVIISNQSAIGRRLLTEEQFDRVNMRLCDLLEQFEAHYDALYFCPHVPDVTCECRKPNPGLILQAACDLDIDIASSFFVGDKMSDIQAGAAAGCRTVLVLTGMGKMNLSLLENAGVKPDSIQETLVNAVEYIATSGNH